jgi:prepilin-type N-terminal cleavage/methylation domain-containing protein
MRCRRSHHGFTLIELVIVLAIAALVLAAILLAVGGAQRSQRDTTTKNSASRVIAAFQNYASNNGSNIPVFGAGSLITPHNYLVNVYDGLGGSPRRGTQATRVAGREIRYEWQATCTAGSDGPIGPIIQSSNPNQYAVDYWVETGTTDVCIDNQ